MLAHLSACGLYVVGKLLLHRRRHVDVIPADTDKYRCLMCNVGYESELTEAFSKS